MLPLSLMLSQAVLISAWHLPPDGVRVAADVLDHRLVAYEGTMFVGDAFRPDDPATPANEAAPCTDQGTGIPVGKGLHFVHLTGGKRNNGAMITGKKLLFRISAAAQHPNQGPGGLQLCGQLGPGPGGVGASCGSTSGSKARGKLLVTRSYRIYDLIWDPTPGQAVTFRAKWRKYTPGNKAQHQKVEGSLAGLLLMMNNLIGCGTAKPANGDVAFPVSGRFQMTSTNRATAK